MKLIALLRNHSHYWGIPHTRATDNKLVMTCYECGAERQVRIELRPSPAEVLSEAVKQSLAA